VLSARREGESHGPAASVRRLHVRARATGRAAWCASRGLHSKRESNAGTLPPAHLLRARLVLVGAQVKPHAVVGHQGDVQPGDGAAGAGARAGVRAGRAGSGSGQRRLLGQLGLSTARSKHSQQAVKTHFKARSKRPVKARSKPGQGSFVGTLNPPKHTRTTAHTHARAPDPAFPRRVHGSV
jgi:hypothetical protein